MAELSEQHKETIVLLLARCRMPAEVVATLKDEFDLEITVRQVVGYDPTRPAFDAGDRWRTIFDAAREKYLADVASIPVANQGYRLDLLQRGIEAAVKKSKWSEAAALAEQAARDVGGVLTNQRQVDIRDGRQRAREQSPEERKESLFALLDEKLAQRGVDPGAAAVQ